MFRDNRGRRHLNDKERGAIIALTFQGLSIKKIADELGIGEATVVLWQKRHMETGDVERKAGSGRPRITTAQQDSRLIQSVRAKPITTAQEVAGKYCFIGAFIMIKHTVLFCLYLDIAGVDVSKATVIRRLAKAGLKPRRAARKFFLNGIHAEKRLTFALDYVNKDPDWWRSVIFSDEKTFGWVYI
jgi:transposase-like protein